MGISGKHFYRFGFLRSEEWQNIRVEQLVRFKAKCIKCKTESFSNDIHHFTYPKSFRDDPRKCSMIVLCRACHEQLHKDVPNAGKRGSERAQAFALGMEKSEPKERRVLSLEDKLKTKAKYAPLSEESRRQLNWMISDLKKRGYKHICVRIAHPQANPPLSA